VRNGRAKIIEVNPRLAGGFIPELVRTARGIDLVVQTCAFACGRTPDLRATLSNFSSIRFVVAPRSGRLERLSIPHGSVPPGMGIETRCYLGPGTEIERRGDFRDRIGHVIAWSPQPGYAADIASLLQQHASVVISGRLGASEEQRAEARAVAERK
jgi:biotin carboxylase